MENKPFRIGITGGIGAGKTTVSNFFTRILSIPCYEADSRARSLMNTHAEIIKEVKQLLGEEAYKDGVLNARYVSGKVMEDAGLTTKLNSIVHPRVADDFVKWCSLQKSKYILKEAALLVEAGSYKDCDRLLVVTAPEEIRINRVMKRDPQRSKEEIKNIMARQFPESEKVALADHVLINDGIQPLIPQIVKLHENWIG